MCQPPAIAVVVFGHPGNADGWNFVDLKVFARTIIAAAVVTALNLDLGPVIWWPRMLPKDQELALASPAERAPAGALVDP